MMIGTLKLHRGTLDVGSPRYVAGEGLLKSVHVITTERGLGWSGPSRDTTVLVSADAPTDPDSVLKNFLAIIARNHGIQPDDIDAEWTDEEPVI